MATPQGRKRGGGGKPKATSTPSRYDSDDTMPPSASTTPSKTPRKSRGTYRFTDTQHEDLLIWYKENPILWEDSEHYKDPTARQRLKQEKIKHYPGLTLPQFENYWKTTRKIFTDTSKDIHSTGQGAPDDSKWNPRTRLVMKHYPVDQKSVIRRDRGTSSLKVSEITKYFFYLLQVQKMLY